MNTPITVTQQGLLEVLLNVATVRPVFIWGPPGTGKSSFVQTVVRDVGVAVPRSRSPDEIITDRAL
jgi:MoxR-like ATPase